MSYLVVLPLLSLGGLVQVRFFNKECTTVAGHVTRRRKKNCANCRLTVNSSTNLIFHSNQFIFLTNTIFHSFLTRFSFIFHYLVVFYTYLLPFFISRFTNQNFFSYSRTSFTNFLLIFQLQFNQHRDNTN